MAVKWRLYKCMCVYLEVHMCGCGVVGQRVMRAVLVSCWPLSTWRC